MIIPARFNGPPGSGNGGYTAGLVAALLDSPTGVSVRLHRPPPLDTALEVRGSAEVYAGDDLIAVARPATVDDPPVPPVSLAQAQEAAATYAGFVAHPFPTCFVCGPDRQDGLRIFPGRVSPTRTAAPFRVPAEVSIPIVWASLDCPGGWAAPLEDRPYVLGELAVRIDTTPSGMDECVVMGEFTGEEGRKAYVRSSLYAADGSLLATARATWIAL